MIVVVGLGNPGAQYANTRHNAGFIVLDILAGDYSVSFQTSDKVHFAQLKIAGNDVLLVKPQLFMNDSGSVIHEITQGTVKPNPENLIVVHDDVDFPVGMVRVKVGGGDGGHNGLKSISEALLTVNYSRVRVGVAPIGGGPIVTKLNLRNPDFVLGNFNNDEFFPLYRAVSTAVQAIQTIIRSGPAEAMAQVNRRDIKAWESKVSPDMVEVPRVATRRMCEAVTDQSILLRNGELLALPGVWLRMLSAWEDERQELEHQKHAKHTSS
jgi:PTH1 family peptidyl-tRNA hydrolase